MEVKCWFYSSKDKFIEGGIYESLKGAWSLHVDYHNGELPYLEAEMRNTEGDNIEWLDEQIEELCTIPKKLFKQLKVRDVIKSRCFVPRKTSPLSVDVCSFVNSLEYSYIVKARSFRSLKSSVLHLEVMHEDYEYDVMYTPKP